MPYYAAGKIAALADQLPTLSDAQTLQWVLALQDHNHRGKRHYDLRLVDPDAGKAHSWALPDARLPEGTEHLRAMQTPVHSADYALYAGEGAPKKLRRGSVSVVMKTPAEILESAGDRIRFRVNQAGVPAEYLLARARNDAWRLRRVE